ncbi:MAG: DUF1800 domain-containing protein [Pyrinomonadaceae bacterium]
MTGKSFSIRKMTAFLILAAMFSPVLSIGANAQQMMAKSNASAKSLTEDQKIRHVLNRLGFGARPGDVERVKAMGLNKYIEQQLNPASIDDSATEAKLQNLDVLKMSNEELFAKYPPPGLVLRAVAMENGYSKADAALLKKKKPDQADNQAKPDGATPMPENGAMPADAAKPPVQQDATANLTDEQRQELQQKVAAVYQQYNLGRPQQLTQELSAARIIRAAYSERQLQEQMVDFWTNHFNVYMNKGAVRWFLPEYDRDVIRPNALGNFKDLLLATAKSPAMLFYLDNFQSVSPNAPQNQKRGQGMNPQQIERMMQNPQMRERIKQRQGITDAQLDQRIAQMKNNPAQNVNGKVAKPKQPRGINENYARELMELHTLGVDGGYTQKDVQEVARCFPGWTIVDPRGYRQFAPSMINGTSDQREMKAARQAGAPQGAESGTFSFNARVHDNGEKIVLGHKINEGGINDGLKVLDILVEQPATAHFIAKKLAVKFVSDNPDEAFVQRIADAFHNSHGDIKTTLRAMFTDPEFYAPENYRVKIKTPFETVISAIRAVDADTNGKQIQAMLAKMGEPLYGYITPNGYPDMAEDWVNTGALLERMNFSLALASNRIPGTRVNLSPFVANNTQEILNKAIAGVLDGEISPATKVLLLKQLQQPLPEPNMNAAGETAMMENAAMEQPNGNGGGKKGGGQQVRLLPPSGNPEVFKVVGLLLGSPDFQRQ